jgi:hypothetical protein
MRADIQKHANEGVSHLHLALVHLRRARDCQEAEAHRNMHEGQVFAQLQAVCDQLHKLFVTARIIE